MAFATKYIQKNTGAFYFPISDDMPNCNIAIVIPCFNEKNIANTINSIATCIQPQNNIALIVVVNHAENTSKSIIKQNTETVTELKALSTQLPNWLHLNVIYVQNLPKKHAGAGWARKIGMDCAISLFDRNNNENGIIVSLDADCVVAPNYLTEIEKYFSANSKQIAATVYFEHISEQLALTPAIVLYELYMRYYKHALAWCGFPNSIYTIGSCFAVKAKAYIAQGGMNRKKAGEDFYFLHKLMPMGEIGEINSTTVYPLARLSDRVPFGTGPVLKKYLEGERDLELTYPLDAFIILKEFLCRVDEIYLQTSTILAKTLSNNSALQQFLETSDTIQEIENLKQNCSTIDVFRKRFFHIFNAFKVLKWMNFSLQNGMHKHPIKEETKKLLQYMGITLEKIPESPRLMLKMFREIDKA